MGVCLKKYKRAKLLLLSETKRKGHVPAVKPVLYDLIAKAGFWVDHRLYARVLQEAGE